MKNWKRRLLCVGIPLAVGGLSALVSGGMKSYGALRQPPLSPPGWVFPVVWTVLYVLMGLASCRVYEEGEGARRRRALTAYGVQLALNVLWSPVFFRGQLYLTAFLILVVLWVAIFITMHRFSKVDSKAGDLLLPYLLWVTFAGYLNLGVFLLN